MSVGPGELVCVVGRVGSGKSSLIGALLGNARDTADAVISRVCVLVLVCELLVCIMAVWTRCIKLISVV